MSYFSALIDEVSDSDRPLSQALLKAKVLASKLRSRSFKKWIDDELNGYPDSKGIPHYRLLEADLYGQFDGIYRAKNVRLDANDLPSEFDGFKNLIKQHPTLNSVASIESLLTSDHNLFGKEMDWRMVVLMRRHGLQMDGTTLNFVYLYSTRQALVTLLASARGRLLDFLLDLQEKYPQLESDDAAPAKLDADKVETAAQHFIYRDCTFLGEGNMGDTYITGQAAAVGPNAKAENINSFQVLRESIGTSSLKDLAQV